VATLWQYGVTPMITLMLVDTAAARAAAYAPATPYIRALATPQAKHALRAALNQAQASAFLNISSATLI
jgi:hypothetical protein